jgi:hypothetical protein
MPLRLFFEGTVGTLVEEDDATLRTMDSGELSRIVWPLTFKTSENQLLLQGPRDEPASPVNGDDIQTSMSPLPQGHTLKVLESNHNTNSSDAIVFVPSCRPYKLTTYSNGPTSIASIQHKPSI